MGDVYRRARLTTATLDVKHFFDLRAWSRFHRLVKHYRPAILTTYLIHADIVGRIFGHLAGIPIIVSSLRARFRGFGVGHLLWLAKLFDPWVDQYIAVSDEVRRYYVDELGFPSKKFTVITNGLAVEEWQTTLDLGIARQLRQSLNLPAEAYVIGTVAQLRPEKGVDRLIAAMAIVRISDPTIQCLLIGDGPEQPQLVAQAKALGVSDRVHFLGNRHDVKDLMRILDIFILPSLFEGMSNALLEAMAAGRTIMVTDTPENREVVTPASARLIDTGRADVLAQAIVSLRHDEKQRKELARAARQRFEEHFNLDRKVAQLDQLYQSLLSRK